MALFMVIGAISVLSILVTEFTYISQLNQKIAFDGLDQVRAHYLAKSGFKLSLLRLKAYAQVKSLLGGAGGAGAPGGGGIPGVPKALVEKVWNMPFFFPIPDVPGMSMADKDNLKKFMDSSGLEGKYSALIESEDSKYNLNMLMAPFAPPAPSPSPSPTAPPGGATPPPGSTPSPSPVPTFNPADAQKSLSDYLQQILNNKIEADQEFADEYRDLRWDDFMDNLVAWADHSYERHNSGSQDKVTVKRAPFYSLSELHMVPMMDDQLYELFAPALTVSTTPGINVNSMQERTLRALVPGMTKEEVDDFFKYRDSEEEDHYFKTDTDFYNYIQGAVGAYKNQQAIDNLKGAHVRGNVRLVTDETNFKITVQAQVNQSIRKIEAWVTLNGPAVNAPTNPNAPKAPTPPPGATPPLAGPGAQPATPNSGLTITYMRML